jgi:hypothetical protein
MASNFPSGYGTAPQYSPAESFAGRKRSPPRQKNRESFLKTVVPAFGIPKRTVPSPSAVVEAVKAISRPWYWGFLHLRSADKSWDGPKAVIPARVTEEKTKETPGSRGSGKAISFPRKVFWPLKAGRNSRASARAFR